MCSTKSSLHTPTCAIPYFEPDASINAVADAVTEHGVAIIERAVSEATIDRLLAEMKPYIEATPTGNDDFTGRNTRRTGSLLARSPASQELIAHPTVLGVANEVVGKNSTSIQLHLTQIIDVGPGEPAQQLHRDHWAWDFYPFPVGFEVELSTIWAGVDFYASNGATRAIPGSHRWPSARRELESRLTDTKPATAEMPKGSVLLYTGSVVHGAGHNASKHRRAAINIDYCLGWLRQEENQYLACPPEAARTLPVEIAKLAGYSRAAYALGYFGDTQDPMEAVHPTAAGAHGLGMSGGTDVSTTSSPTPAVGESNG